MLHQYKLIILLTCSKSVHNGIEGLKSFLKFDPQSLQEVLLCGVELVKDELSGAALGASSLVYTDWEVWHYIL